MTKNSSKKTVGNTSADPTLPNVALVIDHETYHLVWDFNAIARAESLTGFNLLQALSFEGINAGQLRALFFASLLKLQPEITPDDVGSLIRFDTIPKIIAAITDAYEASVPEQEKTSPNAKTPESLN